MRKFYLVNKKNKMYSLQDVKNHAYFTNPSGLGYENAISYIKTQNVYKEESRVLKQSFISGIITFDGYEKYQEFIHYVESSTNLRLIYVPIDVKYYVDIDFNGITKTEKTGNWIVCSIQFNCKSLYYTEDNKRFVVEELEGETRYPIGFGAMFNDYSSVAIDYNNIGHVESELLVEIYGYTQQPQLELFIDGKLRYKVLFDITIEQGEKLLYSSKDGDNYIVLEDALGNQTNVIQCLKLENDNFFKLPKGYSTIQVTSTTGVMNKIVLKILTAYKGV